jgi:class 3 adenylate cyclase
MTLAATQLVGSVLFTDLVGFTEFNDARGDEAAVAVLDQQRRLIDAVLDRHPGSRVVKELGDGLMVWCPDASSALGSAVEFLAAVDVGRDSGEFPLAVRSGIHYGPVRERGADVVGQTVNIASRIAALAGPSELLVSDELLAACPRTDLPDVEPVGPVPVKGVAAAVWLHRVTSIGSRRRSDGGSVPLLT